ncbi:MAG: ectonucleotide pyrophosphatase/phosphodiesterase [Clostridiales bacterium]|jgi:predicted AlkP superfamily pyrophosphatase or phosphodiesterase|nr:ectonucleotide pyrophosphatase/phosphodiesterase [Clostridiales bacterium]
MLLLISLDAVGTDKFQLILKHERLKKYLNRASYVNEVSSVFVSNTYVAHASIVTGVLPKKHKVIENFVFDPGNLKPDWNWFESCIKTDNLFRAANRNKLKVASLLWPVTAKAPVKYNIPEILPRGKETQLMASLKNGPKLFQLEMIFKYGRLLRGVRQPALDNFAFACLLDVIKNKKPDLIFSHFTDVDTNDHMYGPHSKESYDAVDRHAERLEKLFKNLEKNKLLEKTTMLIFGDHSCLESQKEYCPNEILKQLGMADFKGHKLRSYSAWFKSCGGSAFLKLYDKSKLGLIEKKLDEMIKEGGPVKRLLSKGEMDESGFSDGYVLGIEAAENYYFYELENDVHKGSHGYSLRQPGYTTSIIALGKGIRKNIIAPKGSIMDICPTALRILNIEPWETDGRALTELLL